MYQKRLTNIIQWTLFIFCKAHIAISWPVTLQMEKLAACSSLDILDWTHLQPRKYSNYSHRTFELKLCHYNATCLHQRTKTTYWLTKPHVQYLLFRFLGCLILSRELCFSCPVVRPRLVCGRHERASRRSVGLLRPGQKRLRRGRHGRSRDPW